MESDIRTLADLPFHVMGRFQNATVVGSARGGTVRSVTGKEFFEGVRDLSLGLSALGMEAGERVAIIAESRPEWLSIDLAVLAAGSVSVPVYPTLAAAQVRYILQDSAAAIAVVSTRHQLEKIQEIRHQLPALQAIVVMDATAAGNTPSVLSLAEATERGHARMVGEWGVAKQFRDVARAIRPGPARDDRLHIRHDGRAEGRDVDACERSCRTCSPPVRCSSRRRADVSLSFLPLSHTFERDGPWIYLVSGVHVVFAESFDTVGRDIGLVTADSRRPVCRVSTRSCMPASWKTVRTHPGCRAALFRWAVGAGIKKSRATLRGQSAGSARSASGTVGGHSRLQKVREAAWRPHALPGFRKRSARNRHRRVLRRDSAYQSSRVWPDRDPAAPHRQPARRATRRQLSARPSGHRIAHRGGRRDPRARTQRDVGLLQQAGSDR